MHNITTLKPKEFSLYYKFFPLWDVNISFEKNIFVLQPLLAVITIISYEEWLHHLAIHVSIISRGLQ